MAEVKLVLGLNDERFARGLAKNESRWKAFTQRVSQIKSGNPLPPLPEVERQAGGIIGMLRRKFDSADLFKDSLKSIGVGLGVGAIADRITNIFSRGADRAKAMAEHSEAMVDIQRTLAGAMGGPRRELELQVKHVNELNRDIDDQKKLIESLRNTPLEFLSPDYQAQVDQAEDKLNSLIQKQAQLSAGAKAAAHAENLRTAALQRQGEHATNLANIELRHGVEGQKFDERKRALQVEYNELKKQGALPSALQSNLNQQKAVQKEQELYNQTFKEQQEDMKRAALLQREMTDAEIRAAGEVEKKQIRLVGLQRDYEALKKRNGFLSPELQANRNSQDALRGEIGVDQSDARRMLGATLVSIGGGSAGGVIGRRTETERIADRGEKYLAQARDAVRKGQSPEYVRRLTMLASRDLTAAGQRAERSTSLLTKDQADLVGGSAVKLLKEIRDSLAPSKTNAGGSKK